MVRFLQCLCFNRAVQPSQAVQPPQEAAPAPSKVLSGPLRAILELDILEKENKGFGSIYRIEAYQWHEKHDCLGLKVANLFKFLEKNPQIKELALIHCYTNATEEQYISHHLKTNTTLEKFEVHANRMSEKGMWVMMEALCENKTLTTFRAESHDSPGGNYVFDEAHAGLLGKLLELNHRLKLIDLTYCCITGKKAASLAQIYKNLPERNLATLKFDGIFTLNLENIKKDTWISTPVYVQENQSQSKPKM